jgi:hypothetical protein
MANITITSSTHLAEAIRNLRPGKGWVCNGVDHLSLRFPDETVIPPTEEELLQEYDRVEKAFIAAEYQRQRAAEYPPITDYIDGVVKDDQAQIDAYIAACQAVKAKYPKP